MSLKRVPFSGHFSTCLQVAIMCAFDGRGLHVLL
ncbi:UNVERIFIED_ORG: hypothetical protein GGI57_006148 [Rhizobium aethiopicum]